MASLLSKMEVFYQVAKCHSFSRAAMELRCSKGFISLQISALENELGVTLLHRSTRQLKLTEAGETFLQSCRVIINEKKHVLAQLEELKTEPVGPLRISAPPSLCANLLSRIIPKFLDHYPKIAITLDSSTELKDFHKHNIDLALRITANPNPDYIARLITTFKFVICTTAKYSHDQGQPKTPAELQQHNCLIYSSDPQATRWPFDIEGQAEEVQVDGNLRAADINVIKQALLAGQGIARLPEYVIKEECSRQRIQILFPKENLLTMPIYAIYPSNITISPKIKQFLTYLKENI